MQSVKGLFWSLFAYLSEFLRADGDERQVNCFEEEKACVADPDVVSQIHEEYSPRDQECEPSQDQFPPHRPLQRHVSHSNSGCSS